jgi:hypothetical protein
MSQAQRKSAAGASAGKPKKFITNARAIATRLQKLKQAAVDLAIDEGKEGSDLEGIRWWQPALEFEWYSVRKGNQGTQWLNVNYTDASGNKGRLAIRVSGERHIGQIMPKTDEGVAELLATKKSKNSEVKIEKRTKKACAQFQKWAAEVKTEDDGVTIVRDGEGNLLLPGDDKLSPYYAAMALVNEAFTAEARTRLERGSALATSLTAAKKAEKTITAAAAFAAFVAEYGAKTPGDTILSSEQVANIRKQYTSGADIALKGTITAPNTKIAEVTQTIISSTAKKNSGLELPNPMTRIAMNFDKDTGVAQMEFYDKSKPYDAEGKTRYEAATVEEDGAVVPINENNIHKFVTSYCKIDGVVNAEGVCFSNMGISMPISGHVFVVEPMTRNKVGADDVYSDGEDEERAPGR